MLTRRAFVGGAAAAAASLSLDAKASVARAVPLSELIGRSRHFLLGTPVSAQAVWETVGKRRRVVTYSVVRVESSLALESPDAEVLVRSLGGTVGDVGQIVHGEALLALGERSAVFLSDVAPGVLRVTAMSQGHYPVRTDKAGVHRLHAALASLELVGKGGAVERLSGRTLVEAQSLVLSELGNGR